MAISKQFLSSSLDGMAIVVTANTSASANLIHTAGSGTTNIDECWLYAANSAPLPVQLVVGWGDNGSTSHETGSSFRVTIPNQNARHLIVDGRLISNSKTIYAYALTSSVVTIDGFVNRIAP